MSVASMSTSSVLLALAAGYLLGSIPVAVLVARRHGVDPRDVGDRNPGYWNVKEQLGRTDSVLVFAGDVVKGALAGGVGVALDASAWGIAYAAVAAAMVGHAYPVFARFRGGRSILAFAGGVIVIAPVAAALAIAALVVTWALTRSFAMAARVGVFGFPVAQLLVESKERVAAGGALLCIIGVRFARAAIIDRRAPNGTSGAQE